MFRSFRNVWMLEELQVPYEHILLAKPWSKTAKQYHPQGKVPVIVDGDFVLYESVAINTYLGDKYGSTLVPSVSTRQRALYNQTTLTILTEMDAQGLWIHRKHEQLAEYFGSASPQVIQEAKRQFVKAHKVMVSQLESGGGPYLLGKDFTAADILYIHCLNWAKSIEWFVTPEPNTVLDTYMQLCKSRPAYQRTVAKRFAEEKEEKKKQPISKI